MITIQELHIYNKLQSAGVVAKIKCPGNPDHMYMCIACNTILHLGNDLTKKIKFLVSELGSSV